MRVSEWVGNAPVPCKRQCRKQAWKQTALVALVMLTLFPGGDMAVLAAGKAKKEGSNTLPGTVAQFRANYVEAGKSLPKGQLAWQVKANGKLQATPAVDGNAVYTASSQGEVYAFSKNRGILQWQQSLGEAIDHSSPALSQDKLYIGTEAGSLVALQKSNGKVLWKYALGGDIVASPQVTTTSAGATVFVASRNGKIAAVDADKGTLRWQYNTKSVVDASPYLADGRLYIGDYRGRCYALDMNTGKPLWFYTIDGAVTTSPVVMDNAAYFSTMVGALFALDTRTGERLWSYTSSFGQSMAVPPIVISDAKQGDKVFVVDSDGKLTCVNARFGTVVWQKTIPGVVFSPPALVGQTLYVATGQGQVAAYQAKDGAEVWKTQVNSMVESGLVVNQGYLYFGSNNGRLYALH